MRTPQAGLWATAAKLGIANMRKRRTRTLLTGTTIVLLTFAILCFFSTNVYRGLSTRPYSTEYAARAPGVLLHQPNYSRMEERTVDYLDNMLHEAGAGRWDSASVAPRYWWLDAWLSTWRVYVQNPADGSQVGLKAALGWTGGLTLNYSGTHAILAMGIVMAIVVGSALLPAYLAGRLAMPSNRMTWTVPQPEEGAIRDLLPFTVNPTSAGGVLLYLKDFFNAHREGVSRTFTTKEVRLTESRRGYAGLEATVWLAPYDLGVSQHVRIILSPVSGQEEELQAHIELTPLTGAPSSWVRLNKAFLSETRRRLLGWRGLSRERMASYLRRQHTDSVC